MLFSPYSPDFEAFWLVYPRKIAKGSAWKAWQKLQPSPALCETILASVEAHRQDRQWRINGGQYVPHPSTFLNQRRFEDELTPVARPAVAGARCPHDPRCASTSACITRTIADGRAARA